MSDEDQGARGRHLFTGSLVLSALGVGLLVWWFFSGTRSWLVLCVAVVAAFAGVAMAARGRRTPSASNTSFERDQRRE